MNLPIDDRLACDCEGKSSVSIEDRRHFRRDVHHDACVSGTTQRILKIRGGCNTAEMCLAKRRNQENNMKSE